MPEFSKNPSENAMLNVVNSTLYVRLDQIGIPLDCITRKLSWDEAAEESWRLAGEQETDTELMYVTAIRLYMDASNLWDVILATDEIFK